LKKVIIIIVVVVIAGLAGFALLDARGVARTCAQASQVDAEGKVFQYVDRDGQTQTWQFGETSKIIGLTQGEMIGLSFQQGRFSGMLYEEEFYLLGANQQGRVYEFYLRPVGGQSLTMEPVNKPLPVGCPP
jgi:hypothetical protein